MVKQEKVLIVEDEPHALTGLAELVAGWGYRTETARDGVEALDKVLVWQPGIVVTDLKMPRTDGLELLRTRTLSLEFISTSSMVQLYDLNTLMLTQLGS